MTITKLYLVTTINLTGPLKYQKPVINRIYLPAIMIFLPDLGFSRPTGSVSSMLVTDVRDKMCWWQGWDVGDWFFTWQNLFTKNCHHDKATKITLSPISFSLTSAHFTQTNFRCNDKQTIAKRIYYPICHSDACASHSLIFWTSSKLKVQPQNGCIKGISND